MLTVMSIFLSICQQYNDGQEKADNEKLTEKYSELHSQADIENNCSYIKYDLQNMKPDLI